jgi:serine protease Do
MSRYSQTIFLLLLLSCNILLSQDLSELYEQVIPGVVVIETEESELVGNAGFKQKVDVGGIGTGFLYSENQVITAAHVVQTAEKISVRFLDGEVIPGKVVSSYKNADVALIQLIWPKKNPTILKLADSDLVKVGQQVFIVGAPFGLEYSLSSGYISGRLSSRRMASPLSQLEYFQTDASINQGNSGGPMFNLNGEVIGIVSHILTNSGGFEGLGFAATSSLAQKLLLEDNIGWSGIDGYLLAEDMARIFNLPQPYGLLVQKVVLLSPLGSIGVQGGTYDAEIEGETLILGGDIILSINGIELGLDESTLNALAESLKTSGFNQSFEITVLRGGEVITLKKD